MIMRYCLWIRYADGELKEFNGVKEHYLDVFYNSMTYLFPNNEVVLFDRCLNKAIIRQEQKEGAR
jgi:hypothetical protein